MNAIKDPIKSDRTVVGTTVTPNFDMSILADAGYAGQSAQEMAAHESPRTTKLYNPTKERLSQEEVERIRF